MILHQRFFLSLALSILVFNCDTQAMTTSKQIPPVETEEIQVTWHGFEDMPETQADAKSAEHKAHIDHKKAPNIDWTKVKSDDITRVIFKKEVQLFDSQRFIALSRSPTGYGHVLECYDSAIEQRYPFPKYNSWIGFTKLSDSTLVVSIGDGHLAHWRPGAEPVYFERCHDIPINQVIQLDDQRIAAIAREVEMNGDKILTINIYDLLTHKSVQTLTDKRVDYYYKPVVKVNADTLAYTIDIRCNDMRIKQTIRIADLSTGKCTNMLEHNGSEINSLIALNHSLIASSDKSGFIKIWDISTLKCIKKLGGYLDESTQLCRLNDDTLLSYSNSKDSCICKWNLQQGKSDPLTGGHIDMVIRLDDNTIAYHSKKWLYIYDIKNEKLLLQIETPLDRHRISHVFRSMHFDGTAFTITNGYGDSTMLIITAMLPQKTINTLSFLSPDVRETWHNRQAKALIERMDREASPSTATALKNIIFEYAQQLTNLSAMTA